MLLHWQICVEVMGYSPSQFWVFYACSFQTCAMLLGLSLTSYFKSYQLRLDFAEGHQALLFAFWCICTQLHLE